MVTIKGMLGCIGGGGPKGAAGQCAAGPARRAQGLGGAVSMKLWRTASLSYSFCRFG